MKKRNVLISTLLVVFLIIAIIFIITKINSKHTISSTDNNNKGTNNTSLGQESGDEQGHQQEQQEPLIHVLDYDVTLKEQEEEQRTKQVVDRISQVFEELRTEQGIDRITQAFKENPEHMHSLRRRKSRKVAEEFHFDPLETQSKIVMIPQSVENEEYNGVVNKAKALVVLMEYPDFLHNSIRPEDTEFYYEDYSKEHYESLLFSKDGFTGPNGEEFMSLRQYYLEQSGGSLDFTGDVIGWYTTEYGYKFYGSPYSSNPSGDIYANSLKIIPEAANKAAQDPNIDLSQFDIQDMHDYDNDGDFNEPDGYLDHLVIVYAGIGESDGGGVLGKDAVWAKGGGIDPFEITDTKGNTVSVMNISMIPEGSGIGTFAHEMGHSLGAIDIYGGMPCAGNPVALWALMGKGGRNGVIWGSQPAGFSAWSKQVLQNLYGGNWISGAEIDLKDIPKDGTEFLLDEANARGVNNDVIRVNLPDKVTQITPPSGSYVYSPDLVNNTRSSMSIILDMTETVNPKLNFKAWFDLEYGYDFFYVKVRPEGEDEWQNIEGNLTTSDPYFGFNEENSIGRVSENGNVQSGGQWTDGYFSLEAFAGKKIELMIEAVSAKGVYSKLFIDDIKIYDNRKVQFSDDAESETKFYLNGFERSKCEIYTPHYYLLEWRNHSGTDEGLAHTMHNTVVYEPGLLIWYADEYYTDNLTEVHPGNGIVGLIDADQNPVMKQAIGNGNSDNEEKIYDTKVLASYYNLHDASFGLKEHTPLDEIVEEENVRVFDNHIAPNSVFDDSKDYSNSFLPELGMLIPEYGLRIEVIEENEDGSIGKIRIYLEE